MARKSRQPRWTPNPECEAAFERITRNAHQCAALLWGEKPCENPEEEASGRALMLAMAMSYFLCRIDPKDALALYSGKGSFADFDYKPYPPGYRVKDGLFSRLTIAPMQ